MKIVSVQFVSWEKPSYQSADELDLRAGDMLVVETESGSDLGKATRVIEIDPSQPENISDVDLRAAVEAGSIRPVIRKASSNDLEKMINAKDRLEALEYGKEMKKRYDLPMKFIDVHFSFDGAKATFAFIADGRVDFRSLVKDMTRHFGKTIRLQQIGIRDEAKIMGDIGACGKNLCCRSHLRELASITSDMAELQQCAHRGSERISGVCGRLMCCLSYEQKGYEECMKKMPPIGQKVNVDGRKGTVVGHHVLKEAVDVEFPAENGEQRSRQVIDLNRHNKDKK
jgi:cell fate regulator YaaT (PSP1 superfamily)